MKIQFLQGDNSITVNAKEGGSLDKIQGTAINELFAWIEVQRKVGAKGLKLSHHVDIVIEGENFTLDTTEAQIQLRQRLKINSTARSKRAFAVKFCALCTYISRERGVISVNEALEALPPE